MEKSHTKKIKCPVCSNEKSFLEVFPGHSIRPGLQKFIQAYSEGWTPGQDICVACLNRARTDFIENSLVTERGELSEAEREVIEAIRNHELVAYEPQSVSGEGTFGVRFSDRVAEIGGSWSFIIGFTVVLAAWVFLNSFLLISKPFDPYPYILLNLFLSALAAVQAPVIMMSQNRKEAKDRLRAEADYKTNLKAELEIRHLHIKLDELISHQWRKLLEIQQMQMDALKDASQSRPR